MLVRSTLAALLVVISSSLAVAQSALPAPWASTDVGAAGAAGSATVSGTTFTVTGSDIWGTTDAFQRPRAGATRRSIIALQSPNNVALAPAVGTALVITVAPTGMVPRRRDGIAVPEQPEQIAADVVRAVDAGASSVHLHARDEQGAPTYRREYYEEVVRAVRNAIPDIVVSVSTSGRVHNTFEQRSDVLDLEGGARPDLASLTLGSMNFPSQPSVNSPEMIQRLAHAMRERGIVPELEIFDFGMIDYAHYLIQRAVLVPPFVCNLLLGSLGTSAATPLNLALMVERLPAGTYWQVAGIGRFQWPMNALGVITGGHVRTGLEDSLFLDDRKEHPATNEACVRRVAELSRAFGRPIARPAEARRLMGLTAGASRKAVAG